MIMSLKMKMKKIKNKRKIRKKRVIVKFSNLCVITILTVIYLFIFFLLKNENQYKTIIRSSDFIDIQLAHGYAVKKVCTSDYDKNSCRSVIFGDVYSQNDSVYRLKVLRSEEEGFFVTFRRSYVLVTYFLKYEKDIPRHIKEKITAFDHSRYKKFTQKELARFVHNCLATDVKKAHIKDSRYSDSYLNYIRGETCECAQYKMFHSKSTVQRVKFDCNAFKAAFTSGALMYSRHCAVMSEIFYSLFSIRHPPIFMYSVDVKIERYALGGKSVLKSKADNLSTDESVYTLNNSTKFFRNDSSDITVLIRNQTSSAENIVNLSDYYIALPSSPVRYISVKATDVTKNCGRSGKDIPKPCDYENSRCTQIHPCLREGIMLHRSLFDISGVSCNKIGVSLISWRNIPGGFCFSKAGYCLSASIERYADAHLENKIQSPYKIHRAYGSEAQTRLFGDATIPAPIEKIAKKEQSKTKKINSSLKLPGETATHAFILEYKYNASHTLQLYFETAGLEVHEIRVVATGTITHVTPPMECSRRPDESDDCILIVHVWNSSKDKDANFTVAVECSDKSGSKSQSQIMRPIEPITAHIRADKNRAFYFSVNFLTNARLKTFCSASLYDANRKLQNSKSFDLESKEIVQVIQKDITEPPPPVEIVKFVNDKQLIEDNSGKPVVAAVEEVCGCGFNLFCYIFNIKRCVRYFVKKIMQLIGSVALIVILVFLIPVILPFLPFILSICLKFVVLPLRLLCRCMRLRKKVAIGQKIKQKLQKKKKSSAGSSAAKSKLFQKMKKKTKKKYSESDVSSVSSEEEKESSEESEKTYSSRSSCRSSSGSSDSDTFKRKNATRSDSFSDTSKYSGTSLEASTSTVSISSVDSSRESDRTTSTRKGSKKSKRKKKSKR